MTSTAYTAPLCRVCSAVAVGQRDTLCDACEDKRSLVIQELAPRFPRATVTLEAMALATLCRGAADQLEELADTAGTFEPGTLRRRAHAVVRRLVVAMAVRVALIIGALLAMACAGEVEPEPEPHCEQAKAGVCGNTACIDYQKCDAPIPVGFYGAEVSCEYSGYSGDPALRLAFTCRWSL